MLEDKEKLRLKRARARVIAGPYRYVDERGVTEHTPEQDDELLLKSASSGRFDVNVNRDASSVALKYHHNRFGAGKVETLEEIRQRHQQELDEAAKKLEAAQKEAEQREKQAYEKGVKEGLAKGLEEGRQEYADHAQDMQQRVNDLLQATEAATGHYFTRIEERLVDFAMTIARKVVGEAAESHRDIAVELAKKAIEQATERSKIRLIVNPADLEALKEHRVDLQSVATGIKQVEIETSDRVHPGGVILESEGGSIDATIQTMLEEVHKALKPGYDSGIAGEDEG